MKTHRWLWLGVLTFAGCSQSSAPSPKQPVVNEREAGQAWEQFISKAKGRKNEAQSTWRRKKDKGSDLTVEFLRDDVKFDPARGTMIGEVQLKTFQLTVVSGKNVLPDQSNGTLCDFTLRFRYSSGSWEFMDGIRKAANSRNPTEFRTSSVESLNDSRNFYLRELFQP